MILHKTQFWPIGYKTVLQPGGKGQEDDRDMDLESSWPCSIMNLVISVFYLGDIIKHCIVSKAYLLFAATSILADISH